MRRGSTRRRSERTSSTCCKSPTEPGKPDKATRSGPVNVVLAGIQRYAVQPVPDDPTGAGRAAGAWNPPRQACSRADRPAVFAAVDMIPWLLLLTLPFLMFDIATRRLAIERSDFPRALAWITGRKAAGRDRPRRHAGTVAPDGAEGERCEWSVVSGQWSGRRGRGREDTGNREQGTGNSQSRNPRSSILNRQSAINNRQSQHRIPNTEYRTPNALPVQFARNERKRLR